MNPYTETYEHLLGIYAAALAAMDEPVKVGNVISLAKRFPTFKEMLAAADFPGVVLTQGGFGGSPFDEGGNNTDTVTTQIYRLEVHDDTMGILRVNAIKWAALKSLAAAGATLNVGTPQRLDYIDRWRIVEGRDHMLAPNEQGMVTALAVQIHFRHPTHDLSAGA